MNKENKLLRINDVLDIVGVSKSQWYKLMAEGKAPQSVKISHRWVCWDYQEIIKWIEDIKKQYNSE
ncbi:MAG: AlpA family phage regulatory protein [Sulfuricurvum sp.]|jgi:predicted DNA-binding transcriptional regulator AlpA